MFRMLFAILFVFGFAASTAAEEVQYELEVKIDWSGETHPHDWPAGGGHMSGLVGATHRNPYVMFADGNTATSGVKSVAERGRPHVLKAELQEAIGRNRVKGIFQADGIASVPGTMNAKFPVSETHSRVSFVTMIAPSPDWFTGVSAVDLRDDKGWRKKVSYPLWAWDSGTDRGASYASGNEPNQPAESIRLLASPHFLDEAGLKRVGTAVFTLAD